MPSKITFDKFIEKLKLKFQDKFQYIDLSYIDKDNFSYVQPLPIICKIHNKLVYRIPKILMRGNTLNICDECQKEKYKDVKRNYNSTKHFYTINEFKNLLYEKYNDRITIDDNNIVLIKDSLVVNFSAKMLFTCNIHGEFICTPKDILRSKHGCKLCAIEYTKLINIQHGIDRRKTFIDNAIKIHGSLYDYSLVDLNSKLKKIKIICKKHGIFEMMPSLHLRGEGCKLCNENNQYNCERRLKTILNDRFPNETIICQYHGFLKSLSLDFYFPKYKIAIEYQGSLHFEPVSFLLSDSRHSYEHQIYLDELKYNKCVENDILILYFTFCTKYNGINYYSKVYTDINDLIEQINKIIEKVDN